jgi:hypothetical protein
MKILLVIDNEHAIIELFKSTESVLQSTIHVFIPDFSKDDGHKQMLAEFESMLIGGNFDIAVVEYDFHKVITGCFFDRILKQHNIPWVGLFEEDVILFERPRNMGEKGRIVMDGDFLKNKEKLIHRMQELME